jgi:hypothetical protein
MPPSVQAIIIRSIVEIVATVQRQGVGNMTRVSDSEGVARQDDERHRRAPSQTERHGEKCERGTYGERRSQRGVRDGRGHRKSGSARRDG